MINILSYAPGTKIKGRVIKEWIIYHTTHRTSLSKEARKMTKYLNIHDDRYYSLGKGVYQASARSYHVYKWDWNTRRL